MPTGDMSIIINLYEDRTRVYDPNDVRKCQTMSGALLVGASSNFGVIDTEEQRSTFGVVFGRAGRFRFFRWRRGNCKTRRAPGHVLGLRGGIVARAVAGGADSGAEICDWREGAITADREAFGAACGGAVCGGQFQATARASDRDGDRSDRAERAALYSGVCGSSGSDAEIVLPGTEISAGTAADFGAGAGISRRRSRD